MTMNIITPSLPKYLQNKIISYSCLKNKSITDYFLGVASAITSDLLYEKRRDKIKLHFYKYKISLVCKNWYEIIVKFNSRYQFDIVKNNYDDLYPEYGEEIELKTINYLSDIANKELSKPFILYNFNYIKVLTLNIKTFSSKNLIEISDYCNSHLEKLTEQDIQWLSKFTSLETIRIQCEPSSLDEVYKISNYVTSFNENNEIDKQIKIDIKLHFYVHRGYKTHQSNYEIPKKYSLKNVKCINRVYFKLYLNQNAHYYPKNYLEKCLKYFKVSISYFNFILSYRGVFSFHEENKEFFKFNIPKVFQNNKMDYNLLKHVDFGEAHHFPLSDIVIILKENKIETLKIGFDYSRFGKCHRFGHYSCSFHKTDHEHNHQQWIKFCNILSNSNTTLKRLCIHDTLHFTKRYINVTIDNDHESCDEDYKIRLKRQRLENGKTIKKRREPKKNEFVINEIERFANIWSLNSTITFLHLIDIMNLSESFYLNIANHNHSIKHLILSGSTLSNINDKNGLICNALCQLIINNKNIKSLSLNNTNIQFNDQLIHAFSLNTTIKELSIDFCSNDNIKSFFDSLLINDTLEYICIYKNMEESAQNYFNNSKSLKVKHVQKLGHPHGYYFNSNWYHLFKVE